MSDLMVAPGAGLLSAEIYWRELEKNTWCRKFTFLNEATDGGKEGGTINVATKPHRGDEPLKTSVADLKKK